jgi:hypothetical protein
MRTLLVVTKDGVEMVEYEIGLGFIDNPNTRHVEACRSYFFYSGDMLEDGKNRC